jgi:ribosomal protein S18 acetylase RimI-like enzyme
MQDSQAQHASQRWLVTSGDQDPGTVARLLASLPTWFGIPASNEGYIRDADELPTYLARPADRLQAKPVGVLLARRHFPEAAEIHLLAVQPDLHRRGVGRALVQSLEADLIGSGCELLQVKTRGPSRPDAGYELTRRFYTAVGFLPLEELPDLWDAENPCLIMVKPLNYASS